MQLQYLKKIIIKVQVRYIIMRMRKKKWQDEELEKFENYIKNPKDYIGNWNTLFEKNYPIHLEIGIGKGEFLSKISKASYEKGEKINYIGIDVVDKMLALAKRKLQNEYMDLEDEERKILASKLNDLEREFLKNMEITKSDFKNLMKLKDDIKNGQKIADTMTFENIKVDISHITYDELNNIYSDYLMYIESNLDKENRNRYLKLQEGNLREYYPNVIIARCDAEEIDNVFENLDSVQRIYLNFSNPWPKDKHKKRRLTHPTKLEKYLQFLEGKKEIFFKTDDREFFDESLEYFENEGFKKVAITYDLECEDIFKNYLPTKKNIETEHEKMFKEDGKKIYATIFRHD